jgi:hypothetical protein
MSFVSQQKLEANRRNAAKSTGPRTRGGKNRARLNRLTHGMFCHDLVLPGECAELFGAFRHDLLDRLNPQDVMELLLCDRIVSAAWRLRRLQSAEARHHANVRQRIELEEEMRKLTAVYGEDDTDSPESEIPNGQAGVPETPAPLLINCDDPAIDRLSRYEQRLEYTIHRCLRDLTNLRK